MKSNRTAKLTVLTCCGLFASVAGSSIWAAEQNKKSDSAPVSTSQNKAPNLLSKIGKKCIVFYSPAQTTYEEGILIGVSEKWIVISKPYGEESIESWFPMASVHYISFPNLKPATK